VRDFTIRGVDALGVMKRFVKKIKLVDGCWIWTGAVNSKGYPYLSVGGAMVGAHVVAHELFIDRVDRGDEVHHECLNKKCVCPFHLHPLPPVANRRLQTLGVGDVSALDAGLPPF
jgi:hypothetical protein